METSGLKLPGNFGKWEFSIPSIQMNCFLYRLELHLISKIYWLKQPIFFWREHCPVWLHGIQLIVNERRLEAGKLIVAVRNGEWEKNNPKETETCWEPTAGARQSSPFSVPTTPPPNIITALRTNDTTWTREGETSFRVPYLRSWSSMKQSF